MRTLISLFTLQLIKHVSVPVAAIGGLNSPEQMEEIIASGKADVVYMARALLADPFLPRKVTENRENEIVKCLRCFTCMAERAATSTRRCTVNPEYAEKENVDALIIKFLLSLTQSIGDITQHWIFRGEIMVFHSICAES